MRTVLVAASPASAAERPIRVMVVDDAIVARGLMTRWIDAEADMKVTASLRNGREAVDQMERNDPDVVVLDVDMPELDGIAALPLLIKKKRDVVVIMASTLTRRSAETSLRALSLGAADYVAKPQAGSEAATTVAFRRELVEKIRNLGSRARARPLRRGTPAQTTRRPPRPSSCAVPAREAPAFVFRRFAVVSPRVLLIGASTGGPQALTELMGQLGAVMDRIPVLITQHMPPTFTTVLAEHLARVSGRSGREAEHGERVVAGRFYVAPGGHHMRVVRGDGGPRIALGNDAPINFCKPAVDPLLSSAAQVWGAGSLALVLTGMGCDGTAGAGAVVAAGGSVIAQDEATSVVWGMPRSVAHAGLCSAMLPLGEIAAKIDRLVAGDSR